MMNLVRRLAGLFILAIAVPGFAGTYEDMIVAIRNDNTEKVIELVERGMDVNSADQHGTTLAIYASRAGNEKLLRYLLAHRANINLKNHYGDNAIALASLEGHLACVKLLIEAGAEVNPLPGIWLPLNYAAFNGHRDVAQYLLEKGAKVDAVAPNGMTSLMIAARNGHTELARLLLQNHAAIDVKTPDGNNALDIAKSGNNQDIVKLLEAGYQ